MGKVFVPTNEKRKEARINKKLQRKHKTDLERDKMDNENNKGVHIMAFDLTLKSAFGSWLGFKRHKAVMVDRVIISTKVPIPRKDWLRIVAILEECVKEQETKI